MSIIRLCTRNSNCSRAVLWTNVERLTVYFLCSVGNGIGPTISAPFRTAVSTICLIELSISLWSYDRTRSLNLDCASSFLAIVKMLYMNNRFVSFSFGKRLHSDEVRGTGESTRKLYRSTATESMGPRNE